MFHMQAGRRIQKRFENDIEPGGDAADEGIGQSPHQRSLPVTQKLVENQHLAAGAQHPLDFGKAAGGFGHDGQDQVQYGDIEAGCGKWQILRIALERREIDVPGLRQSAAQHGVGQVEPDVMMICGQVG